MLRPPGMDGNDPGTARFMADGAAVGAALAMAQRFIEAHALCADDAARLAIIVEELVANLVEHGAAGGTPIVLHLTDHRDRIGLTLIDAGMAFDPRMAPRDAAIPARGGGRGIALVLAWARVADYTQAEGMNRLELSIPLSG